MRSEDRADVEVRTGKEAALGLTEQLLVPGSVCHSIISGGNDLTVCVFRLSLKFPSIRLRENSTFEVNFFSRGLPCTKTLASNFRTAANGP